MIIVIVCEVCALLRLKRRRLYETAAVEKTADEPEESIEIHSENGNKSAERSK